MGSLKLSGIHSFRNRLSYEFSYTADLEHYFSGKEFWIDYDFDISDVPDSILTIPFLANVLPIIWLTDSTVYIKELDKDFFDCIPQVKKGYEFMFPEASFKGNIIVDSLKTIHSDYPKNNVAMFFSGGLDSLQTLISHKDENPLLVSIWGSDITVDNQKGWDNLRDVLDSTSKKYGLPVSYIRSSFREFDNEGVLEKEFYPVLGDGWWHGVKHGIGLLGHAAPLAYYYGFKNFYIASSHWPQLGIQKCASSPYIDNYVRYSGCQVIHDGFEYSRQDKAHNVVEYCKNTGDKIDIHVCWQTQTGKNCCHCEKCYRMMAGLFAEGTDPWDFGYHYSLTDLIEMEKYITQSNEYLLLTRQWNDIKTRLSENQKTCSKMKNFFWYKWILNTDFNHPKNMKLSLKYRLIRKCALSLDRIFSNKK